jgi:uncharacterized OsmC-like protein
MNIAVRMYAAQHHIPLAGVVTAVSLNRQVLGDATFEYDLELTGAITEAQGQELLQAADSCAVHQTLGSKLSFARRSDKAENFF